MCGITGWVDWEHDLRDRRSVVDRMTATLAPRGPDASGTWVDRHVAFGHRRLSVIDLETGDQPMVANVHGSPVVLTYSGEVYNYQELRAELRANGHEFRGRSDTEVVLRGYLEWGRGLFARLNGMYAFGLWDSRDETLLLVRDRLGVKPLYYAPRPSGTVFGSEPKALLANPLVSATLGETGVAELFALPSAPTPGHGVFDGVAQVRPGHVVTVTRSGTAESAYWSLEPHEHDDDADETRQRVRELLEDVVQRQLVADVPLGALLSGGVDSSAIVALAARRRRAAGDLRTFSVDFPRREEFTPTPWHDSIDQPFVEQVVRHVGTGHTTIVLDEGDAGQDESAVLRARDMPGWGELDISLHRLFAGVRQHTTVALSGESADEVFGGYPYFHDERALAFDGFPWMAGKEGPTSLLRPDVAARARPEEYARERYREALAEVPALDGEPDEDATIRRVGHLALKRWLPALLDRKDRMSMAVGLEVRVPFCDHRLVEYAWNVPWKLRNAGGHPKGVLRDAVADLLPSSVTYRKKSAFPANPDSSYVRHLRGRVDALLAADDAPVFDLVDRARVRAHLDSGEPLPSPRATTSHAAGLGFLVNLDDWLRDYDITLGWQAA